MELLTIQTHLSARSAFAVQGCGSASVATDALPHGLQCVCGSAKIQTMPILLFTDADACLHSLLSLADVDAQRIAVLLYAGDSALAQPLQALLPDLSAVDIASPRFARLNFDAIGLLVVDLPRAFLEDSGGRRLIDALARLAEEGMALVFVGENASLAGGALLDGIHAGLSLVPRTAVIPDLRGVGDLRALLAALSGRGLRLLALDAPVGVRYDAARDSVRVQGAGSVLLAAFRPGANDEPPAARLHVLTDQNEAGWPD